jgi:hypothetical protein
MRGLGSAVLVAIVVAGSTGCDDVCEDAAQLCADEQQVAAVGEDEGEPQACEGAIEEHATCIVEAASCQPDVVARCWADVTGEVVGGGAGGAP